MSGFWSKRRAAVAAEAEADAVAEQAALRAQVEAEQAEKTDEELLEELGLPDPDSLAEGDDFKQFLTEAVPARLKTRALRRLWRVNPLLANLDGLLDYGEDFTDSAMVVENLQTAYQVGKGMKAHVEELARQAEEAESAEDADEIAEDQIDVADADEALEPTPAEEPQAATLTETDARASEEVAADADEELAHEAIRPVHRMTFTFDEQGAA